VARLTGEIDLSNAPSLERTMLDSVPNTATGMVVDLSGVSYLDSAGIRMLGGWQNGSAGASSGSPSWRRKDLASGASSRWPERRTSSRSRTRSDRACERWTATPNRW
jgi:STAS domain